MYFCSYWTKDLEKVLRKTLRKYQLCLGIVETKGKNTFWNSASLESMLHIQRTQVEQIHLTQFSVKTAMSLMNEVETKQGQVVICVRKPWLLVMTAVTSKAHTGG